MSVLHSIAMSILISALGGNALIKPGERGTVEDMRRNLSAPIRQIAELSQEYNVIITHGNGPMVGSLLLQQEATPEVTKMPLEILVAFLKNPKYRLLPILDVIQNYVGPLQKKIDWGYHIPYLITGSMNEHPRSAIAWMNSDEKDDFVKFMKSMHDYELLD